MTATKVNFEKSLLRLEEITQKLESGDLSLDESLQIFEEGIRLSRLCEKTLTNAEQKLEILKTTDFEEPENSVSNISSPPAVEEEQPLADPYQQEEEEEEDDEVISVKREMENTDTGIEPLSIPEIDTDIQDDSPEPIASTSKKKKKKKAEPEEEDNNFLF